MLEFLLMKLVQLSVDTIPAQLLGQSKNTVTMFRAIVTETDKSSRMSGEICSRTLSESCAAPRILEEEPPETPVHRT